MPRTPAARRPPRPPDVETIRVLLRSGEVARALQCVGDRWSFLLMRDAFLGVRRFEDFRRRTGASRGTLTARLNALVDEGLFYRDPYGNSTSRLEYRLTDKGLAFYPVALFMWTWENRWGGAFGLPPRLMHARCGKTLNPVLACAHCEAEIGHRDLDYAPGPGAQYYSESEERDATPGQPGRCARRRRRHDDVPLGRHRRGSLDGTAASEPCSSACTATTTSTRRSASRPTSSPTGCAAC